MNQPGNIIKPLLSIPPFGVHIFRFPVKTWGFYGCIPEPLHRKQWETYELAYQAFVDWFNSLPSEEKEEFRPKLREDVLLDCAEKN